MYSFYATDIISHIKNQQENALVEKEAKENVAWASPRSWAHLSRVLDVYEKLYGNIDDIDLHTIVSGCIGEEKANDFIMYKVLYAKWDYSKLMDMGIDKAFAEIKEQCNNNPTEQFAVLSAGMNFVARTFAENDYKVNKAVKEASKFLFQVVNEFLICGNKMANTVKPLLVNIFNFLYQYCNAIKKNVSNVNVNALMQAFAENLKLANSKEYEKYKYSACVFYGTFCNITKITLTKEELKEIKEAEEKIMAGF